MAGTPPPRGFLPQHPTWLRTLVLSQAIGERRGAVHLRRRARGTPVSRGTPPRPPAPPSESE